MYFRSTGLNSPDITILSCYCCGRMAHITLNPQAKGKEEEHNRQRDVLREADKMYGARGKHPVFWYWLFIIH